MKLSSQSVRTMFGFGLERGRVIEALGNSFQRLWNAFIRPHPLFPQTPTNSTVCRVQVLKACVSNCQKLNGSLKGWLIRRTASKLAQMANMNNTCLNKHLQFPFLPSKSNKDAAQGQLSKFLITLIGSFRQFLIHFNSIRQQYFPSHNPVAEWLKTPKVRTGTGGERSWGDVHHLQPHCIPWKGQEKGII